MFKSIPAIPVAISSEGCLRRTGFTDGPPIGTSCPSISGPPSIGSPKAFQKIYTKITQITKATCSLKATGVGYDELATVNGKLAQVERLVGIGEERNLLTGNQCIVQVDTCDTGCNQLGRLFTPYRVYRRPSDRYLLPFDLRSSVDRITESISKNIY